jgi:deferrochelatase/peroxidase EfeB
LHAHIRKTNPRGESASDGGVTEQQERSHLLVRRGIPYGRRRKHPHDPTLVLADCPSHGVGLLFMAYQSSIERQFEFVQSRWANAPGFVSPDHVAGGPVTGIDPLIGQGPDGGPAPAAGQGCPVAWGGAAATLRKPFDFQGFVRLRGGAYFFAPALSTLKTL